MYLHVHNESWNWQVKISCFFYFFIFLLSFVLDLGSVTNSHLKTWWLIKSCCCSIDWYFVMFLTKIYGQLRTCIVHYKKTKTSFPAFIMQWMSVEWISDELPPVVCLHRSVSCVVLTGHELLLVRIYWTENLTLTDH